MSGGLLPFIYVLAFLAVVLIAQALGGIVFAARERNRSVNRRLSMLNAGMDPNEVYTTLVRQGRQAALTDRRLQGFYQRLEVYCRQAGLNITPARILTGVAIATLVLWLAAFAFAGRTAGIGVIGAGVVSLIGAAALSMGGAWMWLSRARANRLKKLEEQLPLALDVVVRAIRAGHPVVSAVQLAADELGDPVGSEFGLIVDEYTYGSEFKDALVSFARRTGSQDAHFFAVSVGIQSETGGNLAEILDGLASVIRDRRALAAKVKALSSEGKASAMVLSALPVLLIGSLMLLQPSYYLTKIGDPIFLPVVVAVMGLYVIGWIMIQRIINFRY